MIKSLSNFFFLMHYIMKMILYHFLYKKKLLSILTDILFCFHCGKIDIQFTIFSIFKCIIQWHYVHSHCCAVIITVQLQNFFMQTEFHASETAPYSSLPTPNPD